jgi:hypothetical protein
MEHGPVEVIVLEFPEHRFTGEIVPELARLVAAGTIVVIDGVFVRRDSAGDLLVVELADLADLGDDATGGDGQPAADELADLLVDDAEDLLSEDDITDLAAELGPGSAAAILAFEHRWALGLRRAISGAGGRLVTSFRIPGDVVDEVSALVAALDED